MIVTHNSYTNGLAKSVIIKMKIKGILLTLRLVGVVKNIFVIRYLGTAGGSWEKSVCGPQFDTASGINIVNVFQEFSELTLRQRR